MEEKLFVQLDKIGRRIGVFFTLDEIENIPFLIKEKLDILEPGESIAVPGKTILKRVI